MNIEEFREYCLMKKAAEECLPFGDDTLVFKVMGKMFTLAPLDEGFYFSVKTDPGQVERLMEQYPCIKPARYMSKVHWISVFPDGGIDDRTMKSLIDRSYDLVVAGLTKKLKNELKQLPE